MSELGNPERNKPGERLFARAPDEEARDMLDRWLCFLKTAPATAEPLVTHFVLGNPKTPERDAVHEELLALMGLDCPVLRPGDGQLRRKVSNGRTGRIVQQIMPSDDYPAEELAWEVLPDGMMNLAMTFDPAVDKVPYWVTYSVEKDALPAMCAQEAGSLAVAQVAQAT
jgi:hypothetical protein